MSGASGQQLGFKFAEDSSHAASPPLGTTPAFESRKSNAGFSMTGDDRHSASQKFPLEKNHMSELENTSHRESKMTEHGFSKTKTPQLNWNEQPLEEGNINQSP